ncbi:hypothetical protein KHA93_13330 [Bacillus sp. FJAT-49732]|uniref:Uncharacterized protein n=1 Tax=Lederbergia citrisecunda TaxID=2833583 RepID=A0A942YME5_9BACI|nr:hypothetical protein [Lederbergia citrisecunda]MBS4200615.1 hypothetical protein [Lederbergia citrisecunda]
MKRFIFFLFLFLTFSLSIYYAILNVPKSDGKLSNLVGEKGNEEFSEYKKIPESEKIVLTDRDIINTNSGGLPKNEIINGLDKTMSSEKEKIEEYKNRIHQLNRQADMQLYVLLDKAAKEYTEKKERKLDLSRFEAKYNAIYITYENQINEEFTLLAKNFEEEAKQNAKNLSFVDDFNDQKVSRRDLFRSELKKLKL